MLRGWPHARTAAPAVALAMTLVAGVPTGHAQDLLVQGCDERLPGEVGVALLSGNVGQTVQVPVTVHALSDIDAFTLTVDLPAGVLSYVGTDPGDLIGPFDWLDGHFFASTNQVRIVGVINPGSTIPPGSVGSIAVLVFQVAAAGQGQFGTSTLLDDLSTYVSCEDVHGTSAVEAVRWGRVKAAYR